MVLLCPRRVADTLYSDAEHRSGSMGAANQDRGGAQRASGGGLLRCCDAAALQHGGRSTDAGNTTEPTDRPTK
jgi:hypothetical protein